MMKTTKNDKEHMASMYMMNMLKMKSMQEIHTKNTKMMKSVTMEKNVKRNMKIMTAEYDGNEENI